jgi:glyoxylase-like metal-dependent hydrolase (beta-lactamase superfamily II)
METVVPGLHASGAERLPFGPSLDARAYLLEREAGNLLLYRSAALEEDAAAVEELGVARQYLNHWHEAAPANDWAAERFGAPLHVSADDAEEAAKRASVGGTFSGRQRLDDDLEIVPIPGHTPGATAYLWDTGEHRALFTGDTLIIGRNGWHAAVLASSDRERYIESLGLLRGLDFDLLVPWIAAEGRPTHAFVDRDEAERRIDEVLERVRAGSDH